MINLVVWGPVLWSPRIPRKWKGLGFLGLSRFESQTTGPQTTNSPLAETWTSLFELVILGITPSIWPNKNLPSLFCVFFFPPLKKKNPGKTFPNQDDPEVSKCLGSMGYFTYLLFFRSILGVVITHWNPFTFSWLLDIQVDFWYIFLHLPWKSAIHVGKYTLHGWYGLWTTILFSVLWPGHPNSHQGTETSNPRTARLPTVESPLFRNMEAVSVLFLKDNSL